MQEKHQPRLAGGKSPLRRQLLLATAFTGLLLAAGLAAFFWQQDLFIQTARQISAVDEPRIDLATQWILKIAHCRQFEQALLASWPDRPAGRAALAAWTTAFDEMTQLAHRAEELSLPDGTQQRLHEWRSAQEQYGLCVRTVVRQAEEGELTSTAAMRAALADGDARLDHAATDVEDMVVTLFALRRAAGDQLLQISAVQLRLVAVAAVFVLLSLVAGPLWFMGRVLGRVRLISATLQRWLGGDLRVRIHCPAHDEMGRLAQQCNELAACCERSADMRVADRPSARAAEAGEAPAENAVPPTPAKRRCRVLVTDDGPENRRFLALVLRRAGADVELAENGRDAVEKVVATLSPGDPSRAEAPFDLVFMDMQMPVLNGFEAAHLLRLEGYTGQIVALTAYTAEHDRNKCLQAGCDEYYSKPIDQTTVLGLLHAAQQSAHSAHP